MSYAVVSTKVDPETKKEAMETAERLGIPLSNVLKALLKQFVRTKSLKVGLDEIPNERLQKVMRLAKVNYKKGRISPPFRTAEEAIAYLEKQEI